MSNATAPELYRKHRPTAFKHLIGQPEAVAMLTRMCKDGSLPHVLLLHGPSGTGKTTLARILKSKLACDDLDFAEINAAESRGIDTIREIKVRMGMSPVGGPCRIYLLDESHKLSSDAMSALLKILEDTPRHVYFFLCTTDPDKLLPAIQTRCTKVGLRALNDAEVRQVIEAVLTAEGMTLSSRVITAVIEVAGGSARQAVVSLQEALALPDEESQLAKLRAGDIKRQAFDLVKALLWEKNKWADIAKLISELQTEDWESLRRLILACATTEALKAGKSAPFAYNILVAFNTGFYESNKAGRAALVAACYEVMLAKK